MPTYKVTGINVFSFPLGEADKILTIFTAEKGLIRAVAKGSRKPGSKMTGRADVLNVNNLLVATGKSLDIITQAETIESFRSLRCDLYRLSYCLYYAELTALFGQGLSEESASYFEFLLNAVRRQAEARLDACHLSLETEMALTDLLGYKPELAVCVLCRTHLTEKNLAGFHNEFGGVVCEKCHDETKRGYSSRAHSGHFPESVLEPVSEYAHVKLDRHITPLVWKVLVLAAAGRLAGGEAGQPAMRNASAAAARLVRAYIEHKAGKRLRSLDLIESLQSPSI